MGGQRMDTQAGEGLPINPTNPGSSTRGKGGATVGAARMLEQGKAGRLRGERSLGKGRATDERGSIRKADTAARAEAGAARKLMAEQQTSDADQGRRPA